MVFVSRHSYDYETSKSNRGGDLLKFKSSLSVLMRSVRYLLFLSQVRIFLSRNWSEFIDWYVKLEKKYGSTFERWDTHLITHRRYLSIILDRIMYAKEHIPNFVPILFTLINFFYIICLYEVFYNHKII